MPRNCASKMLRNSDLIAIIEEKSVAEHVTLPDTWKEDFHHHIPLPGGIPSFSVLTTHLCQKIKGVLEDYPELGEKYGEIHSKIGTEVRIAIAIQLGFYEVMNAPHADLGGRTPMEVLRLFCGQLEEGETWQPQKFLQWNMNGIYPGKTIRNIVTPKLGSFGRRAIEVIFGDEAAAIFARNPFEAREQKINTIYDARRYLKEFLSTLKDGQEWTPGIINEWTASDGTPGRDVFVWFSRKAKGADERVTEIEELLGKEGAALFKKNPLNIQIPQIKDWDSVKTGLLAFLETIEEGECWSTVELWAWGTDDWNGHNLYKYFSAHEKQFCDATVREILGDQAAILNKKPLKMVEQKLRSEADGKKYFLAFLNSLKSGEKWSPSTLRHCKRIGADGPNGSTLYEWIRQRCSDEDGNICEAGIRKFLGDDAKAVLTLHPFEKIRVLISAEIVREYLLLFLDQLEEGESWSAGDLQSYGEIKDGVDGHNLYSWIFRNHGVFSQTLISEFLGEKGEILKTHPFEVKNHIQVTDIQLARRYFKAFICQLPKGETWSPVQLLRFGRISPGGPTGRSVYQWILRNTKSEDQTLTAEVLQEFLGDEGKILEDYPFQREVVLTSAKMASCYLKKFLESLSNGQKWSAVDLFFHGDIADGVNGNSLYAWIRSNNGQERRITAKFVRTLLGDQADILLRKNPYERKNHKSGIKTPEDAKKSLNLFLQERREGAHWSPIDLVRHGRIGEDESTGASLYLWLRKNVRYKDEVDWLFVLYKMTDPEILRKHPFKHRDKESFVVTMPSASYHPPVLKKNNQKVDFMWDADVGSLFMTDSEPDPEEILMMKQELQRKISTLDPIVQDKIRRFRDGEDLPENDVEMIFDTLEHLADPNNTPKEGLYQDGWRRDKDGKLVYFVK